MAGNLPVPQGIEIKVQWDWNLSPYALNVFHAVNTAGSPMTQARADGIATAIKGAFTSSSHSAAIATGVTLNLVSVRGMDANTDPWFVAAGAAVPGTSAGNPLPAATSFVVSTRTGLRGRSYNGRIYLWGFTEDANDPAGGITPTAAGNANTFITNVRSGMAGAPGAAQMAILSRWTTPPGGTVASERNPPVLTPVTLNYIRDVRWDVQRRRAIPGV